MASRAAAAVEAKFSQLIRSGELVSSDALVYGAFKGISGDDHCFSYRLGPCHAYPSVQVPAISKSYNSDHYSTKHNLVQKSTPLWIYLYCAKANGGNKKVIRTHMVRRVRTAITEALKKHGYDLGGRRISAGLGRDSKGEGLVGTMIISTKERALTAKMDVLQNQADIAVGVLQRMCEQKSTSRQTNTYQSSNQQGKRPIEMGKNQTRNKTWESKMNATRSVGGNGTAVKVPRKKQHFKNAIFGGANYSAK